MSSAPAPPCPPQGRCSAATGFHRDQPSLSMILRQTRAKFCSATYAVPVPGQGTSPLIHRRESHATSDIVKAPRSRDREREVMQKPKQKRTPRKGIHPIPIPRPLSHPMGYRGALSISTGLLFWFSGPTLQLLQVLLLCFHSGNFSLEDCPGR